MRTNVIVMRILHERCVLSALWCMITCVILALVTVYRVSCNVAGGREMIRAVEVKGHGTPQRPHLCM